METIEEMRTRVLDADVRQLDIAIGTLNASAARLQENEDDQHAYERFTGSIRDLSLLLEMGRLLTKTDRAFEAHLARLRVEVPLEWAQEFMAHHPAEIESVARGRYRTRRCHGTIGAR